MDTPVPRRFRGLGFASPLGFRVRVARDLRARALGLAWLDRERAEPGLLIPGCASVHTFGMRFPLDVYFLDSELRPLAVHIGVGPGRVLACRGAAAALELPHLSPLPEDEGGELGGPRSLAG